MLHNKDIINTSENDLRPLSFRRNFIINKINKILKCICKCLSKPFERCERKEDEFMYTPCKHLFHTVCLSHWLNMKAYCPVCRTELQNFV